MSDSIDDIKIPNFDDDDENIIKDLENPKPEDFKQLNNTEVDLNLLKKNDATLTSGFITPIEDLEPTETKKDKPTNTKFDFKPNSTPHNNINSKFGIRITQKKTN